MSGRMRKRRKRKLVSHAMKMWCTWHLIKGNLINGMSHDKPEARVRTGAPAGIINSRDNPALVQGDESVVKPKLSKIGGIT